METTFSMKSKQLFKFFKNKQLDYQPATAHTTAIFHDLYQQMYASYQYTHGLPWKPTIKHVSKCILPKLNHFSKEIATHIEKHLKTEIMYLFSLYDRTIQIYFIAEHSSEKQVLSIYNEYVKSMAMWLYMVQLHANKKCAKKLTIYIYETSLEKKLPDSSSSILNENHANTAFTTTCPISAEIVIFRKEEWFKVFIHETFHTFDFDFSSMNCRALHQCILTTFPLHLPDLRPYEAYTEFWACTINCMFCSFFSLKNKKNVHDFIKKSEYYINMERTYSIFQMIKILQFMGLTYADLYRNTRASKSLRQKYKEDTSIFSYYILKTIVLNHYNGFFDWCAAHNNRSLFDFHKTVQTQQEFCQFITKNYKSPDFIDQTNLATSILQNIHNVQHNYILTNMRMTICEHNCTGQ
jgi:hypothetical protein